MKEKHYPIIEEEDGSGSMTAAEPAVAYDMKRPVSSGIVYMDAEAEKIDRIPLGMFGFYTDDPSVFNQRVAEIEADMDEVDAGIEEIGYAEARITSMPTSYTPEPLLSFKTGQGRWRLTPLGILSL